MPRQSHSSPLPNEAPARSFEIVGLQLSEEMPFIFDGTRYDLAQLSDEQAEYLLGFPEQIPFLRRVTS